MLTPLVAEQELPFTEIPEEPVFDATSHPTLVCSETYRYVRKTRFSVPQLLNDEPDSGSSYALLQ